MVEPIHELLRQRALRAAPLQAGQDHGRYSDCLVPEDPWPGLVLEAVSLKVSRFRVQMFVAACKTLPPCRPVDALFKPWVCQP